MAQTRHHRSPNLSQSQTGWRARVRKHAGKHRTLTVLTHLGVTFPTEVARQVLLSQQFVDFDANVQRGLRG
jgi:hypothetical protein